MSERWVSVQEVADHLGVNKDTIYKWIEARDMPAHRVGRLWKFQLAEIDAWVRSGGAGEAPASRGSDAETDT
jgi:excisionase family DNA binding protein